MSNKDENVFEAVQEKYTIREIAEQLDIRIHKVGAGWRANSIFGNGDGKDAFAIYEQSNTWYDFMGDKGGDITDLVATVKYDGDKGAALRELMPEYTSEKVKVQIFAKQKFMEQIERWHKDLLDPRKETSRNALKYLHSRRISDATIEELKIGVAWIGQHMRIVFPYWDESGKQVLYYTTRRYDNFGNGEDEREPKYMKASLQTYPFLKNSILGLNTLKRDKKEIIVTEGMFDELAFCQQGYSVISPNGGDFGKLMPEAIEKIKEFQRVILVFDGDKSGQDFTYNMARALIGERIPFDVAVPQSNKDVAEFYAKGGDLTLILDSAYDGLIWCANYLKPKTSFEMMSIEQRQKIMKKVKDFIQEISAYTDSADIMEIIRELRAVFPKEWVNEVVKIGRKGITEEEVVDIIKAHHRLLYNERTGFYEYMPNKGIWEAKDDTTVSSYINTVYGRHTTGAKITSGLKVLKTDKEIVSDIPLDKFNTHSCFTFLNGTLHIDLKTGEGILLPYSETDLTTVRLPYRYDPKQRNEKVEKVFEELMNGRKDYIKLLQEFAGYILLPDCRFQKALLLKGDGSNGKSLFTKVIAEALGGIGNGRGYVSAVEPSKLGKDFRLMPFKTSLLNLSTDNENDLRGAEGNCKKIIAGEFCEDSYKHKDPHPFPTRTKMMMCCNKYPTVSDTSIGFMRRFLIVDFPMNYVAPEDVKPNTNDRPINFNLERELLKDANALAGVFNWMLAGLQRLLKQDGFTETSRQKEFITDFLNENDDMVSFVKHATENEVFYENKGDHLEGKKLAPREIFRHYRVWAEESAMKPIGTGKFYGALSSMLKRMGVQFTVNEYFWQFMNVDIDWEAQIIDDEKAEKEVNPNPNGYTLDPDEEMEKMNNGDNIAAQE